MGLIDPVVAPGRWAARWPAALAWDDATPRRPVPSTAGLAAVGAGHRGPRAGRPAGRPGRTPRERGHIRLASPTIRATWPVGRVPPPVGRVPTSRITGHSDVSVAPEVLQDKSRARIDLRTPTSQEQSPRTREHARDNVLTYFLSARSPDIRSS